MYVKEKVRICGVCEERYEVRGKRRYTLCPSCRLLNATGYDELVWELSRYCHKHGLHVVALCCNLSDEELHQRLASPKGSKFRGYQKKHWILRGLKRLNRYELKEYARIQMLKDGLGAQCKICGGTDEVSLEDIDITVIPLCKNCSVSP